jgi:tRNA pseudouridine32 synthase/23S rRNA pseudouridine746 synthase
MKKNPPLPIKNGVSPSFIWLPEGQWDCLLTFLLSQFPDVGRETWLHRIAQNEVVDANGIVLHANSPVHRGMCLYYYREIEHETHIPFKETILFQDQHLVVVDKPHFLPVTPSGRFLRETLLVRLKNQLGIDHLSPIHRLDRETAGVILFSCDQQRRGKYQSLFQDRQVSKIYHALAPHLHEIHFPHIKQSHMVEGDHFLIMKEVEGKPNSETIINILERRGDNSLYELKPSTGKKHQLRLHLASLGAPIINDAFYPIALACKGDDFANPLQLLAKSIHFKDPITAERRDFYSKQSL